MSYIDMEKLQYTVRHENKLLIPFIMENNSTGKTLSLFYADSEALERMTTPEQDGKCYVWRFARSHKKVEKKGATSGNVMEVVSISPDCEYKSLLVKVIPSGPACHTGKESCYD
ncbi:MAG: phosphoribosyl-AMP cyclohydrolase [Candidatus Aenigmatarchaeota archaeon]